MRHVERTRKRHRSVRRHPLAALSTLCRFSATGGPIDASLLRFGADRKVPQHCTDAPSRRAVLPAFGDASIAVKKSRYLRMFIRRSLICRINPAAVSRSVAGLKSNWSDSGLFTAYLKQLISPSAVMQASPHVLFSSGCRRYGTVDVGGRQGEGQWGWRHPKPRTRARRALP
jgi:hypothetical protein